MGYEVRPRRHGGGRDLTLSFGTQIDGGHDCTEVPAAWLEAAAKVPDNRNSWRAGSWTPTARGKASASASAREPIFTARELGVLPIGAVRDDGDDDDDCRRRAWRERSPHHQEDHHHPLFFGNWGEASQLLAFLGGFEVSWRVCQLLTFF